MNSIIIRNKTATYSNSNYIHENYENLKKKDINSLLTLIYKEEYSFDYLFNEYSAFVNGIQSDFFKRAYQLNEECAVTLDSQIIVYKLTPPTKELDETAIPWRYLSRSIYLGDTWWFDDCEILEDLKTKNVIDFLLKYKGI